VGLRLLVFEVSKSHSDTPHSVELLWMQRPPPDKTLHSQERDIHVPGAIRTRNPSTRAAENHSLELRPLGPDANNNGETGRGGGQNRPWALEILM